LAAPSTVPRGTVHNLHRSQLVAIILLGGVAVLAGPDTGYVLPAWAQWVSLCAVVIAALFLLVPWLRDRARMALRAIRRAWVGIWAVLMPGEHEPMTEKPKAATPDEDQEPSSTEGDSIGLFASATAGLKHPTPRFIGGYVCQNCKTTIGARSEIVERGAPVTCPKCGAEK